MILSGALLSIVESKHSRTARELAVTAGEIPVRHPSTITSEGNVEWCKEKLDFSTGPVWLVTVAYSDGAFAGPAVVNEEHLRAPHPTVPLV